MSGIIFGRFAIAARTLVAGTLATKRKTTIAACCSPFILATAVADIVKAEEKKRRAESLKPPADPKRSGSAPGLVVSPSPPEDTWPSERQAGYQLCETIPENAHVDMSQKIAELRREHPEALCVMSWNLCNLWGDRVPFDFDERLPAICEAIERLGQPDVLCIQELNGFKMRQFAARMEKLGYKVLTVDPERLAAGLPERTLAECGDEKDRNRGACWNAIAIQKDRLEVVGCKTKLLPSADPNNPRGLLVADLVDTKTGDTLRVGNTHLYHRGEHERRQSVAEVIDTLGEGQKAHPSSLVIFAGDLNAFPDAGGGELLGELATHYKECAVSADLTVAPEAGGGTFVGSKADRFKAPIGEDGTLEVRAFDKIFATGRPALCAVPIPGMNDDGSTPKEILARREGPSDHLPVVAVFVPDRSTSNS